MVRLYLDARIATVCSDRIGRILAHASSIEKLVFESANGFFIGRVLFGSGARGGGSRIRGCIGADVVI